MDQETILLKRTVLPKLILEFDVIPAQIPAAFFAEVHHLFFKFMCKFEEFIVAESACNAGDQSSIPGLGRSPGEGNGYPLQYSCLENPMDKGAWQVTVQGVTKNWIQRRGAGGAGGEGTPGRLGRAPAGGARGCPERVRGPSVPRDPDPGLGRTTCSRRAGKPAPPRGACGRWRTGDWRALPRPAAPAAPVVLENSYSSAACRERLPERAAACVRVPGEGCSKSGAVGRALGLQEEKKKKDFIESDR